MTEQELLSLEESYKNDGDIDSLITVSIIQECLRLREVLKFYADKSKYNDDNPHALSSWSEDTCTIKMDEGKKAREALQ